MNEYVKKEWQILRSIQAYDNIIATKIYPLRNEEELSESDSIWLKIVDEMAKNIVLEYNELFGKTCTFEEICDEYHERMEHMFAKVEYPKR